MSQRQDPDSPYELDKAAKEALAYAAATPELGPVPVLPQFSGSRVIVPQVEASGIWLVYVPQSHPRGRPTIYDARRDLLERPGAYRHAFAFNFEDPLRIRTLRATKRLTPLPATAPQVQTVSVRFGAPRGRGWRLEDLGEEFRLNWRWWGISEGATGATRDDLLRKILVELDTPERVYRKLPRTIPEGLSGDVWSLERLFGPWKVREA
jgi:hypothetical protein